MRINKIWSLILLSTIFLGNKVVVAQNDDLIHHVIIAVDYSPTPSTGEGGQWKLRNQVAESICKLSKAVVKDGLGNDRNVLSNKDFYSVVAFRANVDNNNLRQYVRPITANGESLLFVKNDGNRALDSCLIVRDEWERWLNSTPWLMNNGQAYSLLSIAKPYCLNFFANCDVKRDVNRTFLIVVSDRVFNGDMYLEIQNLQSDNRGCGLTEINDNEVYNVLYNVNQSYYIRRVKTDSIRKGIFSIRGYVDLYEYVPFQKNFKLSSVLELPTRIKAKRIRGNKYEYDVSFSSRNNPAYKPIELKVYADNGDLVNLYDESTLSNDVKLKGEIDSDHRFEKLKFVAKVRLLDSVYNNTVLSPSDKALVEAGREGLNHSIEIDYEKRANIFFIPMFDFMWFSFLPDDQESAALIWELLIGFVIVLLAMLYVVILYYRNRYFIPTIDEIELKVKK